MRQPCYLVADSLQDAKAKMRRFCESLSRPFHDRYNAAARRIWVDREVRRRQWPTVAAALNCTGMPSQPSTPQRMKSIAPLGARAEEPASHPSLPALVRGCQRIVASAWFGHGIVAAILANAVVIGLDTWPTAVSEWPDAFRIANRVFLGVFIVEAIIKIIAHWPRMHGHFKDGWNVFDFSIIVVSLLPATGELATVARLARLMRVLRLISTLPELRLIVATLMRSIPGMFNVIALMSIIFYIYAVAGYHFFHEADPTHWRNLGISLLSLFRIVTLEDWTDIMYAAMEAHWWAWAYFVSFVVVGTFVVINLFIAVVLNNLDEAKQERLRELRAAPTNDELLAELDRTQEALARLRERLDGTDRA